MRVSLPEFRALRCIGTACHDAGLNFRVMVFMSATRRPIFALAALLLALPAGADPMSEDLRNSVERIVILPIPGESGEAITGTYDKETAGLAGGAARGAEIGQVPVEVGHVPVNIPIPILRELGMLVGGLTGAAERRTQELRDRLTEDLASNVMVVDPSN